MNNIKGDVNMNLLTTIILTYFVINGIGGACEIFRKREQFRVEVKELESNYEFKKSTLKSLRNIGCLVGIAIAFIIELFIWAPLHLAVLIKGRTL